MASLAVWRDIRTGILFSRDLTICQRLFQSIVNCFAGATGLVSCEDNLRTLTGSVAVSTPDRDMNCQQMRNMNCRNITSKVVLTEGVSFLNLTQFYDGSDQAL